MMAVARAMSNSLGSPCCALQGKTTQKIAAIKMSVLFRDWRGNRLIFWGRLTFSAVILKLMAWAHRTQHEKTMSNDGANPLTAARQRPPSCCHTLVFRRADMVILAPGHGV